MYPNGVIFRSFLMMPVVPYIIIFTAYFGWLKYWAKHGLKKIDVPKNIKYFGLVGIPFYVLAISTVDAGYMN